jgi:hypothetical protein
VEASSAHRVQAATCFWISTNAAAALSGVDFFVGAGAFFGMVSG